VPSANIGAGAEEVIIAATSGNTRDFPTDMTTDPALPSALQPQRIWDRCEVLGRLSEQEGGLTRVFLSAEQRQANALVLAWMREAGMAARLDAMGNCAGRYEGERPGLPCLMLGGRVEMWRGGVG